MMIPILNHGFIIGALLHLHLLRRRPDHDLARADVRQLDPDDRRGRDLGRSGEIWGDLEERGSREAAGRVLDSSSF